MAGNTDAAAQEKKDFVWLNTHVHNMTDNINMSKDTSWTALKCVYSKTIIL